MQNSTKTTNGLDVAELSVFFCILSLIFNPCRVKVEKLIVANLNLNEIASIFDRNKKQKYFLL